MIQMFFEVLFYLLIISIQISIILFLYTNIESQVIDCDTINDCFKCTQIDKCIWENAKCKEDLTNKKNTYSQWFELFPAYCFDIASLTLMEEYCDGVNDNNVPLTAKLNSEIKGNLVIDVLYCKWSLTFGNTPKALNYYFDIHENSPSKYYIKIIHSNKTIFHTTLTRPVSQHIADVIEIEFLYYITNFTFAKSPFSLIISFRDNIFTSLEFIVSCSCLGTLALLFIIIGIAAIFYKRKVLYRQAQAIERRFNSTVEENATKIRTVQRNTEIIKRLLEKYTSDNSEKNQVCTVCFENFNEKVTTLACSHIFHPHCIENWCLQNIGNPKCPCCNFEILEEIRNSSKKLIKPFEDSKFILIIIIIITE